MSEHGPTEQDSNRTANVKKRGAGTGKESGFIDHKAAENFLRFRSLVGIDIPRAYTLAPWDHIAPKDAGWNVWRLFTEGWVRTDDAILNVPAMVIVAFITVLLVVGITESANFNNVIVAIKMAVILAFIGIGVAYINRENWVPFIPQAIGEGEFGWGGIVRAAGVIFFADIGFDAVSTAAQEARNAQRDIPIGILTSLAIFTVLYIAVSLVLTGLVKYTELNVPDPIAVAINSLGDGFKWLRPIIKIGAIAGLSSVILVMMMGQPRGKVRVATPAVVTTEAYPGKEFRGTVSFVDPFFDPETRTVRVRVELGNPGEMLKPDMFVRVALKGRKGRVLAVSETAVLQTGERAIVWVETEPNAFSPRAVKVGHRSGGFYEILEGLSEGETVVTSGGYLIDSESQLGALSSGSGPPANPAAGEGSGHKGHGTAK